MKYKIWLIYFVSVVFMNAENTKWVSERSFYSSFAGWSKYAIEIEDDGEITGMLLYAKLKDGKPLGVVKPPKLQVKYKVVRKGVVYILESNSEKIFCVKRKNQIFVYNEKNENLYVLRQVQNFDEVAADIFVNQQNEAEISKARN